MVEEMYGLLIFAVLVHVVLIILDRVSAIHYRAASRVYEGRRKAPQDDCTPPNDIRIYKP